MKIFSRIATLVIAFIAIGPALAGGDAIRPDGYKNLDQKPYASRYIYRETTIDQPLEKVWPQALKIGAWMSDYRLETLAGEPGKVGHFQRVFPPGLGADVPQPHYHLYGIARIIPFKLITLEVFPEKGGSYGKTGEKMSFDNILLTDVGGATKITFLMVDAILSKELPVSPQEQKSKDDATLARLDRYFDNLNRLVKNGK